LDAAWLPQQEILHNEFCFAAGEWSAANAARYLTIIGLRVGFDFDDVVESLTIRALEKRLAGGRKARRFAAHSHGHAPQRRNDPTFRPLAGRGQCGQYREAAGACSDPSCDTPAPLFGAT
jgi:hypothetical protein